MFLKYLLGVEEFRKGFENDPSVRLFLRDGYKKLSPENKLKLDRKIFNMYTGAPDLTELNRGLNSGAITINKEVSAIIDIQRKIHSSFFSFGYVLDTDISMANIINNFKSVKEDLKTLVELEKKKNIRSIRTKCNHILKYFKQKLLFVTNIDDRIVYMDYNKFKKKIILYKQSKEVSTLIKNIINSGENFKNFYQFFSLVELGYIKIDNRLDTFLGLNAYRANVHTSTKFILQLYVIGYLVQTEKVKELDIRLLGQTLPNKITLLDLMTKVLIIAESDTDKFNQALVKINEILQDIFTAMNNTDIFNFGGLTPQDVSLKSKIMELVDDTVKLEQFKNKAYEIGFKPELIEKIAAIGNIVPDSKFNNMVFESGDIIDYGFDLDDKYTVDDVASDKIKYRVMDNEKKKM